MELLMLKKGKQDQKTEQVDTDTVCRMCIACQTPHPVQALLRFVISPAGELVFDVKGSAPGRGAYVCASQLCLQNAIKRKSFNRSFKTSVLVNLENMLVFITDRLQSRILENIGLAYRARQCLVGRTKVQEERANTNIKAIIISCDLSKNSLEELDFDNTTKDVMLLTGPFKNLLGQALGRPLTGVVALLKGPISERIISDLIRWKFLSNLSE